MTEMEAETPKVLDDLRKRRLAYFESGANSITPSDANAQPDYDASSLTKLNSLTTRINQVDLHEGRGTEKTIFQEKHNQTNKETISIQKQSYSSTKKNELQIQENDNNNYKSSLRASASINDNYSSNTLGSLPLKTTSFSINYEENSDNQDKARNDNVSGDLVGNDIPRSSVDTVKNTELSFGEDGYNETVERLIKATKEELLGLKSSDDIWSNIWKTKSTESNPIHEVEKSDNSNQNNSIQNEIHHTKDDICKRTRRSNSESDSQPKISESVGNKVRPRLFPQSSVPSSTDVYPVVSHTQPSLHKPDTVHRAARPNPVEELFSSEQVARSIVPQQYKNVAESQEIEGPVPVLALNEQSVDLSDLGLSTHRPDSGRAPDLVDVEADDINLSDTVTKELRTLLGEEKFKQFLVKSKRDLDDLQQDRFSDVSNGSDRKDKTPRLLKDRPAIPKKPNTPKIERKHMHITKGISHKTITTANNENGKDIKNVNQQKPVQKKENGSSKINEFTPRSPDSEVVNNLIGKYVLNDSDGKKKLNPHSEVKTVTTQNKSNEDNTGNTSKLVPELNLDTLQNDSPRPKLNRPKHEPATIYFDKQKSMTADDQGSNQDSSDSRPSPGRNYDQVTVPRHVAFSANEIYHQAYGAFYSEQTGAVPMNPSIIDYRQDQPQITGHGLGVPLTPKTPTESVPMPDSAGYHQYYVGYTSQGQGCPTLPGMIYPGTPHEAVQHTYPQVEEIRMQQYALNSARQAAAASSQSVPPPPPYNMYNQMYNIPAEYRGYPSGIMSPSSVGLAPHTPTTGIIPTNGMVQPHPLASPANMAPTMGMPPRFPVPPMSTDHHHIPFMPHPPVSTATNQMPGQPSMSAVYSGSSGMPNGYQGYPYPVMMMAPRPPTEPPATPTTPLIHPQSSTTSHAEVQTEEKSTGDDKVTLVEESTFTSVSQIKVDEDMMVPHPPATKKGSRTSPRKHNKVTSANEGQGQQNKRHIEGIRHHHEQKRQQQEGRLTEEQMVEKQRKFAKQSLERYFSSLENLYMSSSHKGQRGSEDTVDTQAEHPEVIESHKAPIPEVIPELDVVRENDGIVDDVTSDLSDHGHHTGFNPVVHGFMDFSEVESEIVTNKTSHNSNFFKPHLDPVMCNEGKAEDISTLHIDIGKNKEFEKSKNIDKIEETDKSRVIEINKDIDRELDLDVDNETLVNSVVTGVSIKAGGLTERLRDIGIDAHGLKEEEDDTGDGKHRTAGKRKDERKGKVLIVCPDCEGLNKEYMSWCTHCGEIIIGVEPMLVSKNREGKIRMRSYKKPAADSKPHPATDIHISVKDQEPEPDISVEAKHDEEDEEFEKPFTLNLDVIKSPAKDSSDTHNASPSKSDGKDSGRPSSDDNDQYKIEQDVVNAICETITDPVLKDYMKSHFTKKGHTIIDKTSAQSTSFDDFFKKEETPTAFQNSVVVLEKKDNDSCEADFVSKNLPVKKAITIESVDKPSYSVHHVHDVVSYGNIGQSTDSHKHNLEQSAQYENNTHSLKESKHAITDQATSYTSIPEEIPDNKHNILFAIDTRSRKQGNLDINKNIANIIPEMTDNKQSADVDIELDDRIVIPPVPNFSASLPVSKGLGDDLRIKIPKNSMDFSEDFSQAGSVVFDTGDVEAAKKAEQKKKEREERRQARRRSKGHGLIDVEVFGYEETQECRNSSRGLKLVPILNLAGSSSNSEDEDWGNSSDEDDISVNSDAKLEPKYEVKLQPESGYQPTNAWDTPLAQELPEPIPEFPEEVLFEEQEVVLDHHASGNSQHDNKYSHAHNSQESYDNGIDSEPGQDAAGIGPAGEMSNAMLVEQQQPTTSAIKTGYQHVDEAGDGPPAMEAKEEWSRLFDPHSPEMDDIPIDPDEEDIPGLDKPFLEQLISQPTPNKSKRRPQATRNKNVKSVVRKSIEEPGYQRKWTRSSTAWSSFNPGELNTSASVQSSIDSTRIRPSSAPRSHGLDNRKNSSSPTRPAPAGKTRVSRPASAPKVRVEGNESPVSSGRRQRSSSAHRSSSAQRSQDLQDSRVNTNSPAQNRPAVKARPHSGDLYRRKQSKQKKSKPSPTDLDLDVSMEMIEHRLPRQWMLEKLQERVVSPGSTYEKYLQMTPRIEAGTLSRWQCLPDELLLHIFAYLDQTTLTQCAQVCHQYYRVAMDESLWKYITIKKRSDLDDDCLAEVAKRHPISLALVQCNGDKVSAKGLRDLFRECASCIKELNVSRCSRGALNGDSIMLHAAARCHHITHVDTSWCNVTDSGLMAISNCCHRLESLCISGCQAVSNDGIETVIKKHGAQLRVLELFGCFNIGPRGLRCISNNCINLLSLNLGQCYKLTDSCIAQLSSSLGRVESLDLRGLKQIRDNCIRRVVKNCTRLKHLSLANCPNITDVSVLEIATYLTDIRSVDLCGCKNVTDNSIRALVNTCSNLRHMDISSTGCTHRSVSMIANFCGQRLETLKINFLTDVTEQSLIKLAKHCMRLQSVHMYGCTSLRNMDKVMSERPTFTIEM